MQTINTEAALKGQAKWDGMSKFYSNFAEHSSSQGIVTCAVMAKVFSAKRTLEVACGSGRHSQLLASQYIQPNGSVLVSCDFSSQMVQIMKAKYESEDFDY